MEEIERRIYKTSLDDIKRYINICSQGDWRGNKYVMIEQNEYWDPETSSEIYVDTQGTDRPNCSAIYFGKITPARTYFINKDICGEYSKYVDFDEFCEMVFDYIKEEYWDKYLL